MNKYLNQRISPRQTTKIEVPSLNNLLKSGSSSNLNSLQQIKDTDKSQKKLRIEIKSRDLTRKIDDIKSFDNLDKKNPEEDRLLIRFDDRKPTTLKETTPSQRSNLQLLRAKSDTDNDKLGKSPRGSTPEKKVREESTRPSRPPIIFTIKWTSSHWTKVEEIIRVDKILGQGSFAKVYQGFDLVSKSIVAIKILDKRKIAELGFQKMAEKEVEIIQSINHPSICKFEKMLEDKNRVA